MRIQIKTITTLTMTTHDFKLREISFKEECKSVMPIKIKLSL